MDLPDSPVRKYSRLLPKPGHAPSSSPPALAVPAPPPAASKRAAAFTKRDIIRVACGRCAKRKSKCDGKRPLCTTCYRSGSACEYDVEREQGRTNFLRRQNQTLLEENNMLHGLFNTLRSSAPEDVYEILRRLNASDSLQETARLIRDSSLLLQSARHQGRSSSISTVSSGSAISSFSSTGSVICSSPVMMSAVPPSVKSLASSNNPKFPGGVDVLGTSVVPSHYHHNTL